MKRKKFAQKFHQMQIKNSNFSYVKIIEFVNKHSLAVLRSADHWLSNGAWDSVTDELWLQILWMVTVTLNTLEH